MIVIHGVSIIITHIAFKVLKDCDFKIVLCNFLELHYRSIIITPHIQIL